MVECEQECLQEESELVAKKGTTLYAWTFFGLKGQCNGKEAGKHINTQ